METDVGAWVCNTTCGHNQSVLNHNVLSWSFNRSSFVNIPPPSTDNDKSFTASYVRYSLSYVSNQCLSDLNSL